MSMTRIPDIAFEIDGDLINLEQDLGCGEVDRIQLHRIHLQLIAGQLGLPVLDACAATIKRRFQAVARKLEELDATQHYRDDILDSCGLGLEFITELDAICAMADEFLSDLDACEVEQTDNTTTPDKRQPEQPLLV